MSKMATEALRQQELRSFLVENYDYERALEEENERLRWRVRLMVGEGKEKLVVPPTKATSAP